MSHANNAYLHCLISAFVVHLVLYMYLYLLTPEFQYSSCRVSVAEHASLSLTWSQAPKTGFLLTWLIYKQHNKRSSLIRVYTVCNSLCIFGMHYSKEKPSCSTFRLITANFRVSEILGIVRYLSPWRPRSEQC